MKCCDIPIYAMIHDNETGASYLVPIQPVKCPFCGEEKNDVKPSV